MACAADLEIDPVLPLQRDFPIVEAARGVHQPERTDQRLRVQTFVLAGVLAFGTGRCGCDAGS
jgi:hypothetical protein